MIDTVCKAANRSLDIDRQVNGAHHTDCHPPQKSANALALITRFPTFITQTGTLLLPPLTPSPSPIPAPPPQNVCCCVLKVLIRCIV